jgi:REG-2-like HAD superfamily hydrolase
MTDRWIVFDAVGTLLAPREPVAITYQAAGRAHGSRLSVDEVGRRFRQVFEQSEGLVFADDGSITPGYATSEESEQRRWQWVVAQVFDDVPQAGRQRLFQHLWQHYAAPAAWIVLPGVAATLTELARAGYRLAVASNFDARLEGLLATLPALQPIERSVISSRAGFRKPAPQFYDRLVAVCGGSPGELCMVGDHLLHDVVAPRAAGLRAVHLAPAAGTAQADAAERLMLAELPRWLRGEFPAGVGR